MYSQVLMWHPFFLECLQHVGPMMRPVCNRAMSMLCLGKRLVVKGHGPWEYPRDQLPDGRLKMFPYYEKWMWFFLSNKFACRKCMNISVNDFLKAITPLVSFSRFTRLKCSGQTSFSMKIQGMLMDKTTESPQVALQYRCDLQSGRRTPGAQNATLATARS